MSSPASTVRHLRWEEISKSIEAGVPRLLPLHGTPRIEVYVAEGGSRIGMRIHQVPDPLIPSPLEEIRVRTAQLGDARFVDVSTDNRRLFREFYDFARDVADRVQLTGTEVGAALRHTLQAWADLLQRLALMSEEAQSGLIGELWFLEWLASRIGWSRAVDAWKGPDAHEHDFALPAVDVEVKTTLKERRIHQIGSLTQLEPTAGRPLFLLSVQLTAASAQSGFTLADLIERIRAGAAGLPGRHRTLLESRLRDYGWVDEHALLYSRSFAHRHDPELVPVDARFPAITPGTLQSLGDKLTRIDRLSYAVNVEGLGCPSTTPTFASALLPEDLS